MKPLKRTTTTLLTLLVCAGLTMSVALGFETPELMAPWTPVTVKTNALGVEVGVWGRSHKLSRALPDSISTTGKELLAGPIRLVGKVSGKPIQWNRGGNFVFRAEKSHAIVTGWQSSDELIVNTTTRVEFDGMMRVDLVVLPQYQSRPKLEQLWLEVPIKREWTKLFHYFPGKWGAAANSGELPENGLALPFKPFVWLGNEEGGLGWFSESDKGWQPEGVNRAVEVVPQAGEVVLRLRLLDSPARLPMTFTFGFQASPVKPWMKDFHERRIWHAPQLGVGVTLPVPKEWWLLHRAFPDRKPLPTLERAAQLGVKTVVFHEDWAPIQNYPMTYPEDEFKRIVSACHQRGMKVLVYHGYEFSPLAPEWGELHDEVLVKNTKGETSPGWYRPPEQRDFKVCYNSVWRERLADGIDQARKRYGFDGVYLDSTLEPWGCCNERHGCGYRAADGSLRPTYPVFAVRRLFQRLQASFHPTGGLINAHQSTCCLTPALAFVDSYWDGEQLTSGAQANNPLANLPLGAFRAEFMGRNYGVPCEFLAYERPPQWTFDHALTVSMLHDVRVRPCGIPSLEKMAPIWNAMSRFGVTEADWHPYWETKPEITAQPESVKVSWYARRGRMLLVVANLSADQDAVAQVRLDSSRISLKTRTAVDALSGETLKWSDGKLTVPLGPMRMRMVRIH